MWKIRKGVQYMTEQERDTKSASRAARLAQQKRPRQRVANNIFRRYFTKPEVHPYDEVEWDAMEGRRACRIAVYRDGSIEDDPETLAEIHSWFVNKLLTLKRVLGPMLPGAMQKAVG